MKSTELFFRAFVLACAVTATAGAAHAQVGYPPERSPFRDLEYRHELTLFGGYFSAADDDAGVAPRSGPMGGIRYDVRVGGPAHLMVRTSIVSSERQALNPAESEGARDLGVHSMQLFLVDAGISVNLTGQKSWRRLVPTVNGGIGIIGGAKNIEGDPYRFGTPFAFTYGVGLRRVPGGRFAMRLGMDAYLHRQGYPREYFAPAADGTSILEPGQKENFWKNSVALTIGASYQFFR